MDQQEDQETGNNFRMELISTLLGQQIAEGILIDDQNPTTNNNAKHTCQHPVFLGNTCTKCGAENIGNTPTIPLWYFYPNLNLSFQEITRLRDENLQSLLSRRKLHLVLDLDHTLVHTRILGKLTSEDKKFLRPKRHGIDHDLPEGGMLFKMPYGWTKLRPYVRTFLREASTMFDMTIFTLGCRSRAWTIAKLLDPDGLYFGMWRVISRDDCGSLGKHKKCLDVLLEHESVVLALDDTEAVWDDHKANFMKVTPYNYFSYFSPEDKEHDASPPRQSWSQLNADESEEDGVLSKVLQKLRLVHASFFDDTEVKGQENFASRNVRQVLQRVEMNQRTVKKHKNQKKNKKKKIGNLAQAVRAVRH